MPDPHAVAKIRARQLLEELEFLLRAMRATNAGVSEADLELVARLKHRLCWCSESYSRRRSVALLSWILKRAAELLIRVVETALYKRGVPQRARWRIWYDTGLRCEAPAGSSGFLPEGVRRAA